MPHKVLNFHRSELAGEYLAQMLDVPGNPPDIRDTVGRYATDPNNLLQAVDMVRRFVYVLCWHASNYESAAMWKLYVQGNEGIAIQSTVGRLKGSLNVAPGEQWIQPVRYYDPEHQWVPLDILEIPLWKRMSFMYEQEVRAVLQETAPSETYASVSHTGIYVPCHVDNLIERVFVAPTKPDFFQEGVQRVVDLFGLNRQVLRSSLDSPPGAPAVK